MMHSSAAKCYLAYTRQTRPTGKALSKVLDIASGIKMPPHNLDVLIRWGSRKPMPPSQLEINQERAINSASDKLIALEKMANAGVPVVPYKTGTRQEVINWFGEDCILLGRKRRGMGGRDIEVFHYRDKREFPEVFDFYSMYIKPSREFRIHVVGDKIVRIQGKYLDYPEKQKNPYVNNYANGFRFRTPRQDLRSNRKLYAIMAVKALGLDFGAVDMIMDQGGSVYVLEVNTAPGCSPLTAKCYAGALALMVEARTDGIVMAEELLHNEMPDFREE